MVRSRTHRNTKRRNTTRRNTNRRNTIRRNTKRRNTNRRNTNRRNTNRRNTKRRNTMRGNFRWMRGGGNVTEKQLLDWIDDSCDESNPLNVYDWPEDNDSYYGLKRQIYLVNNEDDYGNPLTPDEWEQRIPPAKREINLYISVLKDRNDNEYYNTNLSID